MRPKVSTRGPANGAAIGDAEASWTREVTLDALFHGKHAFNGQTRTLNDVGWQLDPRI